MLLADIALGALVTIVYPGTSTGICGKVVHMGEGVGGVPTVWAVQLGGSRGLKAAADEVTPGCGAAPSAVSMPVQAQPAVMPPAPATALGKS